MKSENLTLFIIAALHLLVQGTHGYSHIVTDVQNTLPQLIFIVLVVTVMPLAAVYIVLKGNIRKGAGIFALSMAAAFLFGYFFHFVMNSPDLHSNVIGGHKSVFFHSAFNLALIEFVGFFFGTYVFVCSSR